MKNIFDLNCPLKVRNESNFQGIFYVPALYLFLIVIACFEVSHFIFIKPVRIESLNA